jgi:UTP--glucose-1-phosphate uridylyltransferase
MMTIDKIAVFKQKMERENLSPQVIDLFCSYYRQIEEGNTGYLHENQIVPLTSADIVSYESIQHYAQTGIEALGQVAMIKLNGGLGTTMGLHKAKSALIVKSGLTFIDIIVRQMQATARKHGTKIPLVFMNSFHTDDNTIALLESYRALTDIGFPLTLVQHKFPKVLRDSRMPAECPENPALEWNPPGHGDLYLSLLMTGMLDLLLDRDIRYAFIANVDNLGATFDPAILGYFSSQNIPFLMEISRRTSMDKKGGHIARLPGGAFVLREASQCAPEEARTFQDINKHGFFNTNNLWVNLESLKVLLLDRNRRLELPFIKNNKTLDPTDEHSPSVYQVETAAGSLISFFEKSAALLVPHTRFAPIKNCSNLVAIRSDSCILNENFELVANSRPKGGHLYIDLDPRYYGTVERLEQRFPAGTPSLVDCESLTIKGDFLFGRNVTVRGRVALTNESTRQVSIPDGMIVDKDMQYEM